LRLSSGALLTFAVFVSLVLVYFRFVLMAPPDALLTNYMGEDLSWHLAHSVEKLDWLRQGFLAVGDFWVPRAGGFPAGGVELENFFTSGEILVMLFYIITGSLTLGHHLADMSFYFLSLIFSYWYGVTVLKRRDAGIVFAVAYSFSPVTCGNWEKNVNLAAALFLLPLFLLFLERMMIRKNYVSSLLASLFFILLFLDSYYVAFFALIFVVIRFLYSFITERPQIVRTIKTFGFFIVMSFFLCLPFFYPVLFIPLTPLTRGDYLLPSILPNAYFTRSTIGVLLKTNFPQFAYLGFSTIILAIIPFFLIRSSVVRYRKTYLFYFISFLFFFLYSIGSYSPLNITELIHTYVPLASGVRATNVADLMVVLNLAICAGVGYICLASLVSLRMKTNHLNLKSKAKVLIPLFIVVMVIFFDLTFGFEPTTVPNVFTNNDAYEFVRQQSGNFRIIEIPSVSGQQALTTEYTNHDTINFVYYGNGFYGTSFDFTETWWELARMENIGQPTSSNNLVAYWSFDEGKGNVVQDESGMNNTGIILNGAWTNGISGSALSFNGVNSSVKIPNSQSLDLTTVGAIEFWIKLPQEEDAVTQGAIIGKGGGWNRPGWLVTTIAKNHIRFQWQSEGDVIVDSAMALSYGEWHHVVAVNDGYRLCIYIDGKRDPNFYVPGKLHQTYIDGKLYTPVYVPDTVNASTPSNVRIDLADNGRLPFKGEIDEVKIYNGLDVSSVLAFCGIKYVLFNANPDYFATLEEYGISAPCDWFSKLTEAVGGIKNLLPFWLTREDVINIESALSSSKEFKLVYSDSNFSVYENLRYAGEVFAVSPQTGGSVDFFNFQLADANVTYSKPDLNTIEVHLENKEPVLLVVSQNFQPGWAATIESELSNGSMERKSVPISEIGGISCLSINETGNWKITLHYTYYEGSLMLFPSFYILAIVVAYSVLCKDALSDVKKFGKFVVKPSIFYGLLLTVFSSLIYPRALSTIYAMQFSGYQFVDKYSSGIFLLGISLIVFAGLFYIIRPLTEFESQTHPNKLFMLTYIVLITSTILLALSTNILPPENSSYLAGRAFIGFILLLLTFLMEVTYKGYYDRIKNFAKSLGKQILGIRIRIRSRTLEIIRKSISRQEG